MDGQLRKLPKLNTRQQRRVKSQQQITESPYGTSNLHGWELELLFFVGLAAEA